MYKEYFKSSIGVLEIVADDKNILLINFVKTIKKDIPNALTRQCVVQLKEYFKGKRKVFDLPLKLNGTYWQQRVWLNLSRVAYNNIISYGDLAAMIGNDKAARAIGGAVNKNKIPIIIPCHRVLGSRGKLVGYAGGLDKKQIILDLEKSFD